MESTPLPSWDPLHYQVDLPFRELFYPLGFAFEVQTNSREVIAAAEQSFLFPRQTFPDPPLRLRVLVSDEPAGADTADPRFRAQGHLLALAADARHFGACDLDAGFAFVWVTKPTVSRQRSFRFHYLESVAYLLLTHRHLTSIHGSCVALNGRGIALCGRPGAGKSCLAFACARQGMSFVSDDVIHLLRRNSDRAVLGRPHYLRLKQSAPSLFPDLQSHHTTFDTNGERLIEIRVDQLNGILTGDTCRAECIVFLERQDNGPAELTPLRTHEALERLVQELPKYSKSVIEEQVESLKRLVEAGIYRLRYSELDPAVEQIRGLLENPHADGK